MAKKQWINQSSAELLLEHNSPDDKAEIDWSSSSDSDNFPKRVVNINFEVNLNGQNKRKRHFKQNDSNKWKNEQISENSKPSPSSKHDFCESPILLPSNIGDLSPVLSQRRQDISQSPVIGNRKQLKASFKRRKETILTKKTNSPITEDCFQSQSSAIITECLSPSNSQTSVLNIGQSVVNNLLSDPECIQSTPLSECNKSVYAISSISSKSDNQNQSESLKSSSNSSSPYFKPKKRKKLKKNGWAEKLQNALYKQKYNFAIWQHEQFLKKIKGSEHIPSEEPSVIVKVQCFWKEYEITVIKGILLSDNCDDDNNLCNDNETCLVLLGFNVQKNLNIFINGTIKLFVPFNRKITVINNVPTLCFFNVYKFLSFKH